MRNAGKVMYTNCKRQSHRKSFDFGFSKMKDLGERKFKAITTNITLLKYCTNDMVR